MTKDEAIYKKIHTMVPGCAILFFRATRYYVYDEDISVIQNVIPLREFTIDNNNPHHARLSMHHVNITEVVRALCRADKQVFIVDSEEDPVMVASINARQLKFNFDED